MAALDGRVGRGFENCSFHCLHSVRSVCGRSIGLRPELNKASDLALGNGEEGDGTRRLHSVRDRDVADRFKLAADETIECEAPRTVRRIFMVHASEALSAANALF